MFQRTDRVERLTKGAAILLGLLGLVGGVFWSIAYVNGVYNQEHPWVTAARWLAGQEPVDAVILYEQWDDGPPFVPRCLQQPDDALEVTGHCTINWGPYEEDTAEKYLLLKERLRDADFVWYSSKRIYDSVDELPERYPMTKRYYDAMWSGELGFALALEVASPPQIFGFVFDDRTADESWSLYDHPQVTVFHKVRNLTDAGFDRVLGGTWEDAVPYSRGQDSPLDALFAMLGLGSQPGDTTGAAANGQPTLLLDQPLRDLPVVDNYRWNVTASENPLLAAAWWWLALALLGWAAWPLAFFIFRPLRDRGYLLSRTLGWLLAGCLLWWAASLGWALNLVRNGWLAFLLLLLLGTAAAIGQRRAMREFLRRQWPLLLASEAIFGAAYAAFLRIRLYNPDLWQPWFGGEKFMEFAFLNGILRSPYFPPVDPHFAGGYINYYYFGLYLVAYLIKLTGIYAEVAFNLAIPTIFALTVTNSAAIAYSAMGATIHHRRCHHQPIRKEAPGLSGPTGEDLEQPLPWRAGLAPALLAPLLIAVIGNLDGFAQWVRNLAQVGETSVQSSFAVIPTFFAAVDGLGNVLAQQATLPRYDFWLPSRVIPDTINEFPYWSFLYADLHPHVIAIPFALLCLGLIYTLLCQYPQHWRRDRLYALALLGSFALATGALASINLWEAPTYAGLSILALLVMQVRRTGRVHFLRAGGIAVVYLSGACLLFLPFFRHYTSVGAGGIGLVAQGDRLDQWLLIWGLFLFLLLSWLLYIASRPLHRSEALLAQSEDQDAGQIASAPLGGERWVSQALRYFDLLPRLLYLQQRLVTEPSFGYLLAPIIVLSSLLAASIAWLLGWQVLAVCLAPLGLSVVLLWRRSQEADAATLFVHLLLATGLAILAGVQVIYLKDWLAGGVAYRMNTVFKFFNQVWVLWGLAAAIALHKMWREWRTSDAPGAKSAGNQGLRIAWQATAVLLVLASLAYPLWGTPDRLQMRMAGWRPPLGTLNGLEYMRQGAYTLPQGDHRIELAGDWQAIQWLLAHMPGNFTIVESSEVDYYQKGGTRIATMTGLSGLRGMHETEQRYGELLAERDLLHREFWETTDISRTQQIMDNLQVDLVYVGELERYYHPEGVAKLEQMAAQNLLTPVFRNAQAIIYRLPD